MESDGLPILLPLPAPAAASILREIASPALRRLPFLFAAAALRPFALPSRFGAGPIVLFPPVNNALVKVAISWSSDCVTS